MDSLKVLIVEDEVLIAEDTKDNLLSFGIREIEMAHDKTDAMRLVNDWKPDIVLLDVRMDGERDGIDLGEYIAKNAGTPFIYITAHSDVNMIKEIVKTKPAGYITKPLKKSDLFAAITLVTEQLKSPAEKQLKIKDGYSTVVIDINSIRYIESSGNYITIFCKDKKHLVRQSLDSLLSELSSEQFFRIHRSYLVNVSHIVKYSRKEVELDGIRLPVSRSAAGDFEVFMAGR